MVCFLGLEFYLTMKMVVSDVSREASENQNEVNISSLLESNTSGSNSATMITGPGGIGRNQLNLGGGASLLGA